MVMPGVYWLHDKPTEKRPNGLKGMSRGFDKKTMEDVDFVHRAWKRGETNIDVPCRRLITLGSALMSDDFWEMRGLFVETTRNLALNGDNSKRYPIAMTQQRPHKALIKTVPQDLMEDYDMPLSGLGSLPYPVSWLDLPQEDGDDLPPQIAAADAAFYLDMVSAWEA